MRYTDLKTYKLISTFGIFPILGVLVFTMRVRGITSNFEETFFEENFAYKFKIIKYG